MQTQCPHCDTQFRITETQISSAEGFVRCGVCNEVFNTFDVANQHEQQTSLLDDSKAAASVTAIDAIDDEKDVSQHVAQQTPASLPDIKLSDNETTESTLSAEAEDNFESKITAKNHSDKDKVSDDFDFFDESALPSQQSVIPDDLRNTSPVVNLSTLLWSTAILMLVASLFLEYTWFNRHQLNQLPELQGWIDKLCLQIDCGQITVRDPKKIELVSRNVYSHPTSKGALMVAITIKNNAEFAQPYPLMQIDFSDIRGGLMASRRFLPGEYLHIKTKKMPLLPSGGDTSFTMEIMDPGKQAKTYEFNFL